MKLHEMLLIMSIYIGESVSCELHINYDTENRGIKCANMQGRF